MKKLFVTLSVLVGLSITSHAQDNLLQWFSGGVMQGPGGTTLTAGAGLADGPLLQLITIDGFSAAFGGVNNAPEWNMGGGDFEDTTGVISLPADGGNPFGYNNVLVDSSFIGSGTSSDGTFSNAGTFDRPDSGKDYIFNTGDDIFARIWDGVSSDGAGNLPTPVFYGNDLSLVAIFEVMYPEIATHTGAFYHDYSVATVSDLFQGGSFYDYNAATFNPSAGDGSGWVFLAAEMVPEPGSLFLCLMGMAVIGVRRFRGSRG